MRPAITDTRSEQQDCATSASVRRSMQANRRVDTRPELRLRSALHARGLRFRKDHLIYADGLRVHADVAFPRAKVAVFVDGCFWHCCPIHATQPKTNEAFWTAKLGRNVDRDRRVDSGLVSVHWTVVRIWEHEHVEDAANLIQSILRSLVGNGS